MAKGVQKITQGTAASKAAGAIGKVSRKRNPAVRGLDGQMASALRKRKGIDR